MGASSRVAMVIVPRTYGVGVCGDFELFTLLSLARYTSGVVRHRCSASPVEGVGGDGGTLEGRQDGAGRRGVVGGKRSSRRGGEDGL